MAKENTNKTSANNDDKTSKSVRFPNDLIEEINAGIDAINTDFSKVVVYKLRHYNRPLTSEIVVKIQNIVNHSLAAARHGSTEPFKRIQMEVNDLWKYLKFGDMVFQEKYTEKKQ
jgi:hypothetical protein